MEPMRVLYVNGGLMDRGGISSYMMNYYRNVDKLKLQIDFIVHGFEKGIHDDEIENLGGKIYNVPIKSKDYFGNIKALTEIFSSGKYKIVHSHMDAMNMVVLKIAKKCGIPIRIAHSHSTQHILTNKVKFILNEYARKRITKYATHYFACSKEASRWLFGNEFIQNNKVNYIKNAIDIDSFRFNQHIRNELRSNYKLEDNFVIGHVGGFNYQKNHLFLLDVFNRLIEEYPNSMLVLVGDGKDREIIERKIENLHLNDKVIFAGAIDNVNQILNGFDLFCLPSLFEGMPIVSVEAQVNGLPCLFSSTITKEAKFNSNVSYLDLESSSEMWAKSMLALKANISNRQMNINHFIDKGYSIKNEAEKLQNIYFSLLRSTTIHGKG